MQETNYCAHAIDSLRELARTDIHPDMRDHVERVIPLLHSAMHFRLPEDGKVFSVKTDETVMGVLAKYCPHVRLPFPVISLEFSNSIDLTKTYVPEGSALSLGSVFLVEEIGEGIEKHIMFSPFFKALMSDGSRRWFPAALGAYIFPRESSILAFSQHGLTDSETAEDVTTFDTELRGNLTILAQFLSALSCSNTCTRPGNPPSVSLNAKRRKKGKTPFFSYTELTLSSERYADAPGQGSAHGSPRVHLRRGHIRRLPDKTVWVNAHVVGDKNKGLVHKDYKYVSGGLEI